VFTEVEDLFEQRTNFKNLLDLARILTNFDGERYEFSNCGCKFLVVSAEFDILFAYFVVCIIRYNFTVGSATFSDNQWLVSES